MKLTEIAPDWTVGTKETFWRVFNEVYSDAYERSWVYGQGRPYHGDFNERFWLAFFKHMPTQVSDADTPDEVIWKRTVSWGREHAKEIGLRCPE